MSSMPCTESILRSTLQAADTALLPVRAFVLQAEGRHRCARVTRLVSAHASCELFLKLSGGGVVTGLHAFNIQLLGAIRCAGGGFRKSGIVQLRARESL